MKMNSMLSVTLMTVIFFGGQSVSAQFNISIPKIPKVKKEKTDPPKEEKKNETPSENQSNETNRTNPPEASKSSAAKDVCAENDEWIEGIISDEINPRQKEVDNYKPGGDEWLVTPETYNFLLYAISLKARNERFDYINATHIKQCPKLVAAFNKLAASAAIKLTQYVPNTKEYSFHNPAEEKILKSQLENFADLKIYYSGLKSATWQIEQNNYGVTTARYKYGVVWVHNTKDDHPYCYAHYVNVVQDHAGGGTYSASYGILVDSVLVGCPAGK